MLHGNRHGRRQRTWDLRGAVQRIVAATSWMAMGSSDKRKKNDDYDMESFGKGTFGKGAFATSKGKGKAGKKTVPYSDIAGVLMVGLVLMAAVYTVVHGMTSTMAAPVAIVKMYEPTESDIDTVEQLIAMHHNQEHEKLGNTLMYVVENSCKHQFPFQMDQHASLAFHSHMMQMVNFMADGGDIKSLAEGHVVVGEDGAIYTLDEESEHHSGAYSSCDLVNAFLWYNHHKQTVHTKEDVEEHWEETYDTWEEKHTSVTGDMDKDARMLMSLLASGNAFDFEIDFLDAVNTHCHHIMGKLTPDQTTSFVAQGYSMFSAINDGALKLIDNPQIVVSRDGRLSVHDGREALHYETQMTCPLLDKALHFQPKTLDEHVETLMTEIGSDIFSMELTMDALISEHCHGAVVNMDKDAFHHFHGHLMDFATAVKEQRGLGTNDIVVLRTGELVHRAEAKASGISPSQFLSCPLVQALSQRGDHQHKQEDADEFTDKHSVYQEEREELMSNTYSLNPTRDVAVLFNHLQSANMYDFENYLWDTLFVYHGELLSAAPSETQQQLHHSFARFFSACVEKFEIDATKKLLFNKIDGEIYYADDMTVDDASDMVESPLLDELLKYAHFAEVEEVVADYHTAQHSSQELVADVEHLFEHASTEDWFYMQTKISDLAAAHCGDVLKALSEDENAESRRTMMSEIMFILDHLRKGAVTPDSNAFVMPDGRVVLQAEKPDSGLTCALLDEMVILGKAQNKHLKKTAEEKKVDEDKLREHLAHEHKHHTSEGLVHDVDFLIKQAKNSEVDDLVADLVEVLDDHCPEYRENLRYKAKGVAQGHLLQLLKHIASDRPLDNKVVDAAILTSGHIVSEAEAKMDGEKIIQCPLARELFSR